MAPPADGVSVPASVWTALEKTAVDVGVKLPNPEPGSL